ncbi:MAG TPA: class I SAM-dependent methyltransferase [bacterium]|nr:class I SAM-dependent methyltransferase [bacterium]
MTRFTQGTARIVQCQACGLLYTDPPISGEYYQALQRQDLFDEMRAAATERMNVYTSAVRTIDCLNIDRERWRILDVGCGMGLFLCAATAYGYDCYGIEASETQAAWCRQLRLNVRYDNRANAFDPQTFHVVTMLDVLEHIARPKAILASIWNVLQPGGYLLARVPNGPYNLWKARALQRFRPGVDFVGAGEHVAHFSASTISTLLTSMGYQVVAIRSAQNDMGKRPMERIKRGVASALASVGDLLRLPLGASLLAVARRPRIDARSARTDQETGAPDE